MVSIKKFNDFKIFESGIEPETILKQKLDEIEVRINKLFDVESVESEEVKKFAQSQKEAESKPSDAFKRLEKQSLERSQFSKTYKNIKLIFSDENFRYDLTFSIDLEKAAPADGTEVKPETIEDCQVQMKRYSLDDDTKMSGQIEKDVKIKDISESMIEDLLVEIEESYPTDKEVDDWSIETE
jgi:hypothetical protein